MAVANYILALCIALTAVSNPSAHAIPLTYPQQLVLIQQTSTIDEITTALSVSIKGNGYYYTHTMCSSFFFIVNCFIAGGTEQDRD